MQTKCLLIETKDKKKFFTLIKNYKNLTEYCKAFGAKMFIVKAEIEKKQVLDIAKLVPALCDKNYKNKDVNYKILK
jgi:hypothetical protein